MSRRFALIVNPLAAGGRSQRCLPEATRELTLAGAEHRVVMPGSLAEACREAAAAGANGETVVALGGDGLVGPIAGALRGADTALAIVPAGRGNDLARVLGIPSDPRAAARLAVEAAERRIDVAAVNGCPYVGIASLGFDSDANRLANESRLVRGNLVYVYAALRALAGWRHATFRVTVDGMRHEVTGYSVAVANSKAYGGGMWLVPHAQLDDGRLDVLMLEQHSKLKALVHIPRVFKGTHGDDPLTHFLSGERIEIEADRDFVVYADGDPIGELPATVTVEHGVLRLVAPPREAEPTP